jgi:hybrid cluster-associated redox disulfide protein
MAEASDISSDITVKELLEKHPWLLHMFVDLKLHCPGCPAEAFHTLAEVAQEYKLDLDQLLRCINESIEENASSQ